MKAHIKQNFFTFLIQSLILCGNFGNQFLSLASFFWRLASTLLQRSIHHVSRAAVAGRVACLEFCGNDRALIGFGLGMVGFISLFAYLLFPESARDFTWYYVNWFYFLETVRLWIAICFFSTCFLFSVPSKYKSIWVVYALTFSVGLCGVVHYSFFVTSFESYHAFPFWYVIVPCFSVGFGFIMAMDYLCYRKYHLRDGNLARIKGIIKAPNIPAEEKVKYLDTLIAEREDYNNRF